jgi:hypothetical protein
MITDEKFKEYIGKIGEQYEELKDLACKHADSMAGTLELYGKLAEFRDTACIALRESHTTKNYGDN